MLKRIAIVEDDAIIRKNYTDALERCIATFELIFLSRREMFTIMQDEGAAAVACREGYVAVCYRRNTPFRTTYWLRIPFNAECLGTERRQFLDPLFVHLFGGLGYRAANQNGDRQKALYTCTHNEFPLR